MAFNGLGFVAFLDLLGFSARTMENWHAKPSALDVIVGLKERISYSRDIQPRIEIEGRKERWDPSISSVSDSIILTYGMRNPSDDLEFFMALASISLVAGNLQLYALAAGLGHQPGFVVRGSIEYGPFFQSGHEVIGPAFIEAYNLEAGVAGVARVIAGPRLLKHCAARAEGHGSFALRDLFYRSRDGLLSFSGGPGKSHLEKLIAVRNFAPASLHYKYAEVIGQAQSEGEGDPAWMLSMPSAQVLSDAAQAVGALLSDRVQPAYRGED